MASDKTGSGPEKQASEDHRLRLYLIGVAALVALAALSFILVPSGSSPTSRCGGFLFQQSKYSCIESTAIYLHNSTMCSELPQSYRNYCYLGIARNVSDAAVCGRINSTNLSNQCYMNIANRTDSFNACGMISGGGSSACAYSIAVKTGNRTGCSRVYGAAGQAQCNDTIKFNDALKTVNASACSKISGNEDTNASDSILQNSSIGTYSQISANVSQLLELTVFYNQSIGARDLCYASVAYESLNKSDCGRIGSVDISNACYSSLAKSPSTQATNSTANLTALYNTCAGTPQQIDACRYTYTSIMALQTGNLSMCQGLPQNYSATCFYYLAKRYNSTRYCSYIQNATLNSACVGDMEGLYPTSTNTSG